MIPEQQLKKLKPLPDQKNRMMLVKKKPTVHTYQKITKRARQFAYFPETMKSKKDYSGPHGNRWMGNSKKEKKNG